MRAGGFTMARKIGENGFQGFDENFMLTDKVSIITGGAGVIGKATAKMFARKGAKVAVFDVNGNMEDVAKEIAPDALGMKVDLTDNKAIEDAVKAVKEHFGRIDVLCNIAGQGHDGPAEEITPQDWERVVSVNMTGLFFMCQSVGKVMIQQGFGGKIINMSSQAGVVGLAGHALYGATKAAVINITKVLANEWGKYNINVNAVSPTVILTPMCMASWGGEKGRQFLKGVPIGRFGFPDEAAGCFVFLASDAADMITGENLVIDGGFTVV